MKLGNVSEMKTVTDSVEGTLTFRVQSNEYFVPISGTINIEEEIQKLSDELQYTEGFLKSVQSKLSNERFVNNAPAQVIEVERKKEADALAKIETLKSSLSSLQ
jgi:valyl-tRNA synthetase